MNLAGEFLLRVSAQNDSNLKYERAVLLNVTFFLQVTSRELQTTPQQVTLLKNTMTESQKQVRVATARCALLSALTSAFYVRRNHLLTAL